MNEHHKRLLKLESSNDVQLDDIKALLHEQRETIKAKRSLSLRVSSFPNNVPLTSILFAVRQLLYEMSTYIDRLSLAENGLNTIPEELSWICDDRLKVLDLHGNELIEIPDSMFSQFPHLEFLDLSSNHLWNLPPLISSLESLRLLNLSDNAFSYIPPKLGEITSLEKLLIENNPLLFPSQQALQSLEKDTIRLKAFLLSNNILLESNLSSQSLKMKASSTRSRSSSDVRGRSSKASKRMGLIINKNKKSDNRSEPVSRSENQVDSFEQNVVAATDQGQTQITPRSPPATVRTRSRQNTMTEINDMLQRPELHDSESGAYFRRLSTLQELPHGLAPKERPFIPDSSNETANQSEAPSVGGKISSAPSSNLKQVDLHPPYRGAHETSQVDERVTSETSSAELIVILKVARKILFSFSEFHSSIKRLTGFCVDRKIAARTISLLHHSKADIDFLVETMEMAEERNDHFSQLVSAVITCVISFKQILKFLVEYYAIFVARIDVCFIRMVYLTIFGAFGELQNAHRLLNPANKRSHPQQQAITADFRAKLQANQISEFNGDTNKDFQNLSILPSTEHALSLDEIDEKLYESVEVAVGSAQVVFNELTKAINKSAVAFTNNGPQAVNQAVAAKFKDLTTTCMSLMDITKRLSQKVLTIKFNSNPHAKKAFWDDINIFLKAIIQTFSSVKLIMKDAPILNDVRQSMANLTRATKELTILLEASSYSNFSESSQPSSFALNNSHTNLTHLGQQGPPVRMPLVAAVGAAAAQAIMPNGDNFLASQIPSSVSEGGLGIGGHETPFNEPSAQHHHDR